MRATGVMLFFLSKHYFTSRNCLREVKATLDEKLPLVLVHEQQEEKGGGPLEMMRAECRKEMRPYVFDGRAPIAWHRISHYQNLTLKLIATEMLRHGPKYTSSSQLAHLIATAHRQRSSSTREELTPSERSSRGSSLVEDRCCMNCGSFLGHGLQPTIARESVSLKNANIFKVQCSFQIHSKNEKTKSLRIYYSCIAHAYRVHYPDATD